MRSQWSLQEVWWENDGNKIKFKLENKHLTFFVNSTGINFPTDPDERTWFRDISLEDWLHISKYIYHLWGHWLQQTPPLE
jgi:hypothetical protein